MPEKLEIDDITYIAKNELDQFDVEEMIEECMEYEVVTFTVVDDIQDSTPVCDSPFNFQFTFEEGEEDEEEMVFFRPSLECIDEREYPPYEPDDEPSYVRPGTLHILLREVAEKAQLSCHQYHDEPDFWLHHDLPAFYNTCIVLPEILVDDHFQLDKAVAQSIQDAYVLYAMAYFRAIGGVAVELSDLLKKMESQGGVIGELVDLVKELERKLA